MSLDWSFESEGVEGSERRWQDARVWAAWTTFPCSQLMNVRVCRLSPWVTASVWRSCNVARPLISDICGRSLTDHLHPPSDTSVNPKYQSNKKLLKWATAQNVTWLSKCCFVSKTKNVLFLVLGVGDKTCFVFYCCSCIFYAWNTQKKTFFVYSSLEKGNFKMTKHQTCRRLVLSEWVDVSGWYEVQFRTYETGNHPTVTRQQGWLLIINRKRKPCHTQTEKCPILYVTANNEMVAAAVVWIANQQICRIKILNVIHVLQEINKWLVMSLPVWSLMYLCLKADLKIKTGKMKTQP